MEGREGGRVGGEGRGGGRVGGGKEGGEVGRYGSLEHVWGTPPVTW